MSEGLKISSGTNFFLSLPLSFSFTDRSFSSSIQCWTLIILTVDRHFACLLYGSETRISARDNFGALSARGWKLKKNKRNEIKTVKWERIRVQERGLENVFTEFTKSFMLWLLCLMERHHLWFILRIKWKV